MDLQRLALGISLERDGRVAVVVTVVSLAADGELRLERTALPWA